MDSIESDLHDPECVTVAVISDLHVYNGTGREESPVSYIPTGGDESVPEISPFSALRDRIAEDGLTADFLLCCGDMADKAEPTALKHAWSRINDLARGLRASLIATAGNHDMDSRFIYNDYDPRGQLQALEPEFPIPTAGAGDFFWARNYFILESSKARIVVLNSAAHHGYSEEYKNGRIAKRTLSNLKGYLSQAPQKPVNILLCHHHPHLFPEINSYVRDYSEMDGGSDLIDALGTSRGDGWIIIHGHKHFPRVSYANGGANAPVIFSAGSFAALPYPEVASFIRNQFYLIRFPFTQFPSLRVALAGRFKAWDWTRGLGWQPAQLRSGIPFQGGFGSHTAVGVLAGEIEAVLANEATRVMQWNQLVASIPELPFLLPQDNETLVQILDQRNIGVISDGNEVIEVARRTL